MTNLSKLIHRSMSLSERQLHLLKIEAADLRISLGELVRRIIDKHYEKSDRETKQ